MAPISSPADDAATEALIARLIAEDFEANVDSFLIGSSIEDYEEPMSSYERGVADGTISQIPSWGIPNSDTSDSSPCSAETVFPASTGEGWDDSVAWEETSCANASEDDREGQEQCEGHRCQYQDNEWCVMSQTSILPSQRLAAPVSGDNFDNAGDTNNSHAPSPQTLSSDLRPFLQPGVDASPSDTVPSSPLLGPQREDSNASHFERHRAPSPLLLDKPSSPVQAPVPRSQLHVLDRSRSELSIASTTSNLVSPVKFMEADSVGEAIVWPRINRYHSRGVPTELSIPRLSAADRYLGLDIDFSSSKGKGKAYVFDGMKVKDAKEEEFRESSRLKQRLRTRSRESNSLLDDCFAKQGDEYPIIRIPLQGLAMGRDEQEMRRIEDLAVVEIRIGEDETLESILNDICNPSSPQARERLEASVSSGVSTSTAGTQGSRNSTSLEQGTAFSRRGRIGRDNEPQMRSLRQTRRMAYERVQRGWKSKRHDRGLLYGEHLRGDEEILRGMPKETKGKRREIDEAENEEVEIRGRTMERDAHRSRDKPAVRATEVEAE